MRGIFNYQMVLSARLKTKFIHELIFVEKHACIRTLDYLSDRGTDMVFSSDFSVNKTQNELLLSFGIIAVSC